MAGRPHYYLAFIGVVPEAQGKGYGADLMRHTLKKADERDVECYLECSRETNVPFYQKHGFAVWRQWRANESAPISWLMHRPKKSDTAQSEATSTTATVAE